MFPCWHASLNSIQINCVDDSMIFIAEIFPFYQKARKCWFSRRARQFFPLCEQWETEKEQITDVTTAILLCPAEIFCCFMKLFSLCLWRIIHLKNRLMCLCTSNRVNDFRVNGFRGTFFDFAQSVLPTVYVYVYKLNVLRVAIMRISQFGIHPSSQLHRIHLMEICQA